MYSTKRYLSEIIALAFVHAAMTLYDNVAGPISALLLHNRNHMVGLRDGS